MKIKKAIVLYKRTAYDTYVLGVDAGEKYRFTADQMRRFRKAHKEHYDTLRQVEGALTEIGVPYAKIRRGHKVDYRRFDLVIAVGGDGTFFDAARTVTTQPVIGVNSNPSWSVGRFCVTDGAGFRQVVQRFVRGTHDIQLVNRLRLALQRQRTEWTFLNDILVCHNNPAAISRYYLTLGKRQEEQKSSGLWVSTAAGSTGAIRSAGGKVLPFHTKDYQYMPRELYAGPGKKYHLRGAIVPSSQDLRVVSFMRDGVIYADGDHISFAFPFGELLTVSRSPYPLRMVK